MLFARRHRQRRHRRVGHIAVWLAPRSTDAFVFNRDISDWSVSRAGHGRDVLPSECCNQPIGKWDVDSSTKGDEMFSWTYKFNQQLDWCLIVCGITLLGLVAAACLRADLRHAALCWRAAYEC